MSESVKVVPHLDFYSMAMALEDPWMKPSLDLRPLPVVVPHRTLAEALEKWMARQRGVAMGWRFLVPTQFVLEVTGLSGKNAWEEDSLTWAIYNELGPFLPELGGEDFSCRQRLALSQSLARQFILYGHFRQGLIASWAERKSGLPRGVESSVRDQEKWQRSLWEKLRVRLGGEHPALVLQRAKADAGLRAQWKERYPRLLVLGSGSLDPLVVDYVKILEAAGSQVEVQAVLPSLGYLGDLRQRRQVPEADTDPDELVLEEGHPLLASMGRHAVGTFVLMGCLDEQYTWWPEGSPEQRENPSLLHRLQQDVRSLSASTSHSLVPEDRSLTVHSCFGRRREMEALADEILRAFREIPDLQPEDIHVVTTDPELYRPLVASVLEQVSPTLPVQTLEAAPGEGDPLCLLVQQVLEMVARGSFRASEFLVSLEFSAVQKALGVEDDELARERLRERLRSSGLTRGLSDSEGGGGLRESVDRMVAGRWFGQTGPFRYPDGDYILPMVEELGSDFERSRALENWLRSLEEHVLHWQREPLATPEEWRLRLRAWLKDWWEEDEEAGSGEQVLWSALREITGEEPLDAAALADWLGERKDQGRRSGLTGRIRFGRMDVLQNVPCRVLAVLGLDDTGFPGKSRTPVWDLLSKDPRIWDRNPQVVKRQLFLDALMTPSDRLILSAPNGNTRTNKADPLSICLEELLRVLETMGVSREQVLFEHRLHPFVEDYFLGGAKRVPLSFSRRNCEVVRILRSGEKSPEKEEPELLASKKPTQITLSELRRFWKNPAEGYLRSLGGRLVQEEDPDEDNDYWPLRLSGLDAYHVKAALFEAKLNKPEEDPNFIPASLRVQRLLPPGNFGDRVFETLREKTDVLAERIRQKIGEEEKWTLSLSEDLPELTGAYRTDHQGRFVFFYRIGKMERASHFQDAWLTALGAAAAGFSGDMIAYSETGSGHPMHFTAPDKEKARAHLENLLRGYLTGQKRPLGYAVEASAQWAAEMFSGKGGDLEKAYHKLKNSWMNEGHFGGLPGEGQQEAALLAWQDRDPFADPEDWHYWAKSVALPLRRWQEERTPFNHGDV